MNFGSDESDESDEYGAVRQKWQPLAVGAVVTPQPHRTLSQEHVNAIRDSFAQLGGQLQLQPIVVDSEWVLIDGAHRLEAAKQAGWSHVSAVIIEGAIAEHRQFLETEANSVRRMLTVLELEQVWRSHYEPALRAAAKRRQLQGLKNRFGTSNGSSDELEGQKTAGGVIGNSNNVGSDLGLGLGCVSDTKPGSVQGSLSRSAPRQEPDQNFLPGSSLRVGESLASAAKRITGYSLETLNKVTQIKGVAGSSETPEHLRNAARRGLQRLTRPGASIDSIYRSLRTLQQQADLGQLGQAGALRSRELLDERQLESTLAEVLRLADRFDGSGTERLIAAARCSDANRQILRSMRHSLARSLATVVSAECRLEVDQRGALRSLGAEVSRLLSTTSVAQLGFEGPALKRMAS